MMKNATFQYKVLKYFISLPRHWMTTIKMSKLKSTRMKRHALIIGFAAVVIAVLLCACDSYNARSLRRTNFNNKWNCEFKRVNGILNGTFKAKQDAPDLVITNRLEEGTATISVLSHGEVIVPEKAMATGEETIHSLPVKKGDRVRVRVTLTDAKGSYSVVMP